MAYLNRMCQWPESPTTISKSVARNRNAKPRRTRSAPAGSRKDEPKAKATRATVPKAPSLMRTRRKRPSSIRTGLAVSQPLIS